VAIAGCNALLGLEEGTPNDAAAGGSSSSSVASTATGGEVTSSGMSGPGTTTTSTTGSTGGGGASTTTTSTTSSGGGGAAWATSCHPLPPGFFGPVVLSDVCSGGLAPMAQGDALIAPSSTDVSACDCMCAGTCTAEVDEYKNGACSALAASYPVMSSSVCLPV